MRKIILCILLINITYIFISCGNESNKKTPKETISPNYLHKDVIQNRIPDFNADSAYKYIETQVDFGPRYLSSNGWNKCEKWITKKLSRYADEVYVQKSPVTTYDGKLHEMRNIIASFRKEKSNRIALFAHWDTRHVADHDSINQKKPILGANDGGSGVGVLIELARLFHKFPPHYGIDIILFDAEDYGQPQNSDFPIMEDSYCLGSQYWSKNLYPKNYQNQAKFGILLDMVGGKNATFYKEQVSLNYASGIIHKVWKKANGLGFGNYFINETGSSVIDDHLYVNMIAKIPTINIIEFDPYTKQHFNKHWHTHNDNMDNIDKATLNAVGKTLLHIIYEK